MRVSWLCLPVDVRFTRNANEVLHCREMMRWANNGLMHQQIASLSDLLVGAGEQRRRHVEAKRLG
jgi:hypothetical protein